MEFFYFIIVFLLIWTLWKGYQKRSQQKNEEAKEENVFYAKAEDDEDDEDNEIEEYLPVNVTLLLDYVDAKGEETQRIVDVREFGVAKNGHGIINGRCQTRKAIRTFRIDRIKRCVVQDTGEIINDIPSFLMEAHKSSPYKIKEEFLAKEYDFLRILLYIGKSDSQLRKEEREIIRSACKQAYNNPKLTDDMVDDIISGIQHTSLQAFKLAVGRIAKSENASKNILIPTAEKMISTQKDVHFSENEALEYLKKKIKE